MKLPRCPNGTRRNKKGECEPKNKTSKNSSPKQKTPTPPGFEMPREPTPTPKQKTPSPVSNTLKRCPNGQRRNKITKKCEPKNASEPKAKPASPKAKSATPKAKSATPKAKSATPKAKSAIPEERETQNNAFGYKEKFVKPPNFYKNAMLNPSNCKKDSYPIGPKGKCVKLSSHYDVDFIENIYDKIPNNITEKHSIVIFTDGLKDFFMEYLTSHKHLKITESDLRSYISRIVYGWINIDNKVEKKLSELKVPISCYKWSLFINEIYLGLENSIGEQFINEQLYENPKPKPKPKIASPKSENEENDKCKITLKKLWLKKLSELSDTETVTSETIRKIYKKISVLVHPDKLVECNFANPGIYFIELTKQKDDLQQFISYSGYTVSKLKKYINKNTKKIF